MNIIHSKPPIWDEAAKAFGLKDDQDVFFTWGNTIYYTGKAELTPELLRHEETHAEQQEHHPDVAALWWKRYIQDQDFRLDQETEAYGEQYRFYCQNEKRRDIRARYLWTISGMLSGPMYGSIITHTEAVRRIREYAELTNKKGWTTSIPPR